MLKGLTGFVFGLILMGTLPAFAQDAGASVDLVLPGTLASSDAPFYRNAHVKIGEEMLPVQEVALAGNSLAEYQPEQNRVVVSNSKSVSDIEKGQALLDVVTALQASTVMPAAGR